MDLLVVPGWLLALGAAAWTLLTVTVGVLLGSGLRGTVRCCDGEHGHGRECVRAYEQGWDDAARWEADRREAGL